MWNVISRLPAVATLFTFVCVVIMFALGVWQLQRAEQKTNRLLAIEQAAEAEQVGLSQVLQGNINQMLDMPVAFEGQADTAHYFLLDNKTHHGQVGYHVLVPMDTESGVLLVNFGWLAATKRRDILPSIQIDGRWRGYQGMVSKPLINMLVKETALIDGQWPKVLQQTDLSVVNQHYQQAVLPFVVLLAEEVDSGFIRNWQPVVMPPEKHMAYAMQWFLLAFAALAVFVFAHKNKLKKEQK